MSVHSGSASTQAPRPAWYLSLRKYGQPDLRKATWQIVNTFVPYLALLALMIYAVQREYSYWITLALGVVAGGLLARIFIFFHDCGHGSFFASRRANRILGYVSGILAFTPYEQWRHFHAIHHATVGDLDRRGVGDVWTMTVKEYRSAPTITRLAYRVFRNPLFLFVLGPPLMFLGTFRFPLRGARGRERYSVIFTDLALLAILLVATLTIGLRTYLLVQLPVILVAAVAGVWMFYVQHQYQGVYWARHKEWDLIKAAIEGSSYYKLPAVLQWFTGNIGLHHVHHARSRIPNYRLQQCYDDMPALQQVEPLTFRKSLACMGLHLYDEKRQRMVSFRSLKELPQ
jgi:omega-6 fatty acid desaturase (delta-12 desaturase)